MPSDEQVRPPNRLPALPPAPADAPLDPMPASVRNILSGAGGDFRSSLVAALAETGELLASVRSAGNGRVERTARELAAFGEAAMDPDRFSRLLSPARSWDAERLGRFEEARALLEEMVDGLPGFVELHFGRGIGLHDAVNGALAEAGRAFGVVRALALLRQGAYSAEEHGHLLQGVPFDEWRGVERTLARPVVVWTSGEALAGVAGLDEFLDGGQKIVLLVQPPCPPAPLARLIAPGTAVLQTTDPAELEWVAGRSGPAVAALVPEGAARFRWDPEGGEAGRGVLTLEKLPEALPDRWVGGMSPERQRADLRLLEIWARNIAPSRAGNEGAGSRVPDPPGEVGAPAAFPEETGASSPPNEPAERLAAWLLSQARLDERG